MPVSSFNTSTMALDSSIISFILCSGDRATVKVYLQLLPSKLTSSMVLLLGGRDEHG